MSRISRNTNLAAVVTLALVAAVVTGCDDRTIDDWRRERVEQELSKYAEVSGYYSGSLTSKSTAESLGELELEIISDTAVTDSADRLSSEQRAILRGSITFSGGQLAVLDFDNGYYDPKSGRIRLSVNSNNRRLDLIGVIKNGTIAGQIQAPGYGSYAARIELSKTRDSIVGELRQGLENRKGTAPAEPLTRRFYGDAHYPNGKIQKFALEIDQKKLRSEDEFIQNFLPTREVALRLLWKGETAGKPSVNSPVVLFKDAVWDSRSGALKGRTAVVSLGVQYAVELDCQEVILARARKGFSCAYSSDLTDFPFTAVFEPQEEQPGKPEKPGE